MNLAVITKNRNLTIAVVAVLCVAIGAFGFAHLRHSRNKETESEYQVATP
ncbi:MAG: hypothetical protein KGQ36_00405 [Rickettsiales bacterium]|nr:hypothetical protein [Rickettsiales bacterium]